MCYTGGAVGPTITVSGDPLDPFSSAPGVPSAEQSYTVTGSELTADILVAAPEGFEVSATSGSGFGATATLPPVGGTVYVRFNRATPGTSAGDIAHSSAGATARTVAVSGTAIAPLTSWIAYNDLAWASGQPETNITKYTIPGEDTSNGVLVDYATGQDTPASVTITASGDPFVQTDPQYAVGLKPTPVQTPTTPSTASSICRVSSNMATAAGTWISDHGPGPRQHLHVRRLGESG